LSSCERRRFAALLSFGDFRLKQETSGSAERRLTYGPVAKTLHWLIFLLVAAQFVVAWRMPPIKRGVVPESFINLHLSLGVLILLVVIVRLTWRLGHPVPIVSESGPAWLASAARLMHVTFYGLLIVLPILGWAAASARDWDVRPFDLAILPRLLAPRNRAGLLAGDVHTFLSYTLLALVGLHVAAALYHHVVARDRVLQRMLPGSP
jgi:cytochrome b561